MADKSTIALIDKDVHRRAAIVHALSLAQLHVEPYETVAELAHHWPERGAMMIYDDPGAVAGLLTEMSADGAWLPVVAYSEAPSAERIVRAVLDGALEYLNYPVDPAEVGRGIAKATDRANNQAKIKFRENAARSLVDKLTGREREVLTGVASGLSNRKIGEQLSISPRTVEIHRANMLGKLNARHTSEAIRIAIEANMVD